MVVWCLGMDIYVDWLNDGDIWLLLVKVGDVWLVISNQPMVKAWRTNQCGWGWWLLMFDTYCWWLLVISWSQFFPWALVRQSRHHWLSALALWQGFSVQPSENTVQRALSAFVPVERRIILSSKSQCTWFIMHGVGWLISNTDPQTPMSWLDCHGYSLPRVSLHAHVSWWTHPWFEGPSSYFLNRMNTCWSIG